MADELTITQRAVVGDMRQKLKKMGDPRADDKSAIVKILEISRPKLFPSKKEDGGKVEKPKTLPKPKPKIGDRNEMGPIYTDTKTGKKVKRLNKGGGLNAAIDRVKKTQGMKKGGEVPKKFKGFSKLPEKVQIKMDPVAAEKYEDGGAVRGMGRAYMGASRKAKIR